MTVFYLYMSTTKKYFVTIAGNIGSGKSSLTHLISQKFGWIPYYESVSDNPYLSDFYGDMSRWSFNLQIYFLAHRFKIHKDICSQEKSVIQDRSIYEDAEIFAKNIYDLGRMEERDFETYRALFYEMTYFLKPPDLLVYLKADVDTLLNQIRLRGREYEKNIEKSYIEELNKSYDKWIENYSIGKCITIETDNLDFVNNENDFELIAGIIAKSLL